MQLYQIWIRFTPWVTYQKHEVETILASSPTPILTVAFAPFLVSTNMSFLIVPHSATMNLLNW